MAAEGDLRGSAKKSHEGGVDDLPLFNAENLQSNMKSVYYSRTFLSIISGVVAGIWGFTGLTGFVFYFLVMAVASLGLAAKAKFSVQTYFDSWNRILLDGIFGGLMSFVLFWTIVFPFLFLEYQQALVAKASSVGWPRSSSSSSTTYSVLFMPAISPFSIIPSCFA